MDVVLALHGQLAIALPNLVLFVLPILLIASLFYADWKWLKPSGLA